jgi:hypothetical protein
MLYEMQYMQAASRPRESPWWERAACRKVTWRPSSSYHYNFMIVGTFILFEQDVADIVLPIAKVSTAFVTTVAVRRS